MARVVGVSERVLSDTSTGSGVSWLMGWYDNGQDQWFDSAGGAQNLESGSGTRLGVWQAYALTSDVAAGTSVFYRGGDVLDTKTRQPGFKNPMLGGYGGGECSDADVGALLIYNFALSSDQVQLVAAALAFQFAAPVTPSSSATPSATLSVGASPSNTPSTTAAPSVSSTPSVSTSYSSTASVSKTQVTRTAAFSPTKTVAPSMSVSPYSTHTATPTPSSTFLAPLAFWPFDTSATLKKDAVSSVSFTSVSAVSPVWSVAGFSQGGIMFSDAWVRGNVSALSTVGLGRSSYTFVAMVQIASKCSNNQLRSPNCYTYALLSWGSGTSYSSVLSLRTNGSFLSLTWGTGARLYANATSLFDGGWHQVATTFNGTSRVLYLDGVIIGSDTPISSVLSGGNVFSLGYSKVGTNEAVFSGKMDSVGIYGAALNTAKLASLVPNKFSSTSVTVVRVGNGTAAIKRGIAQVVFVDEYTTAPSQSAPVKSIRVTSTVGGCTLSANSSTSWLYDQEGIPLRSSEGGMLSFPCYSTAAGTSIALTADRIAAVVDLSGHVDTTSSTVAAFASAAGNATYPRALRQVALENGVLYYSAAAGAPAKGADVGTGSGMYKRYYYTGNDLSNGLLDSTSSSSFLSFYDFSETCGPSSSCVGGKLFNVGSLGWGLSNPVGNLMYTDSSSAPVPSAGGLNRFEYTNYIDPIFGGAYPDMYASSGITTIGAAAYPYKPYGFVWSNTTSLWMTETAALTVTNIAQYKYTTTTWVRQAPTPAMLLQSGAMIISLAGRAEACGNFVLYATSSTKLYSYNTATNVAQTLATAPTNTVFRGVTCAPYSTAPKWSCP